MKKQWREKNVDLTLLSKTIEDFLKAKGYRTRSLLGESKKKYRISATLLKNRDSTGVVVRIYGEPNDFVMELDLPIEAQLSKTLGSVIALFGGGYLYLRGLKSEEAYQKLEEDFWLFAEEAVARLIDSTKERP